MDADVIVVGAGPAGLLLAAEPALAGAGVLVLERGEETTASPMVRGVHPRTLETLDRRGLLEAFRRHGRTQSHVLFAGSWPLDLTGLATSCPYSLAITQGDVVAILAERAHDLGVRVLHGHDVREVTQDPDAVTVTTSDGVRLRSRYLTGCDGGHSRVRTTAGFGFPGTPPTVTGIVGDVTLSPPDALPPGARRTPTGLVINGGGPSALSGSTVAHSSSARLTAHARRRTPRVTYRSASRRATRVTCRSTRARRAATRGTCRITRTRRQATRVTRRTTRAARRSPSATLRRVCGGWPGWASR